jgi:hypothetical protein
MLNWDKVDELIKAGYISVRKHPTEDLFIITRWTTTKFLQK